MMKTIIGLVGEKGAGKETFGRIFRGLVKSKTVQHIRFSDLLRETLEAWDLPVTRKNLQDLAVIMDKGFGKGTLARALKKRIENMEADFVIIDGLRWQADLKLLRSFPQNYLIYITADLQTRYERIKNRGEKSEEKTTSFEQFLKEEQAKNELLIPKIGKKADFKIINEGNIKEFKNKVVMILNYFG